MEIEDQEQMKKPHITTADRWHIVALKDQGMSASQISKILPASKSAINALYQKYQKTHDIIDLSHTGRPNDITEEERKMVIETTNANPDMTLNQIIKESEVDISKTKCYEILKSHGYDCVTAAEKWYVDKVHQEKRLTWAREYIKKPDEYWNRIIFTDECSVDCDTRKQRLWLPEGTEAPSIQRNRWQDTVLVWGAINSSGKFILEILDGTMNAESYVTILKKRLLKNFPTLRPCIAELKGVDPLIYQHDGAAPHTASIVNTYFSEREIEVISWPPVSPDLNLIESIWSVLKSKLKKTYVSREDLIEDIINSYNLIPSDYIKNLYSSMRRRIEAVIDSDGLPTKY